MSAKPSPITERALSVETRLVFTGPEGRRIAEELDVPFDQLTKQLVIYWVKKHLEKHLSRSKTDGSHQ